MQNCGGTHVGSRALGFQEALDILRRAVVDDDLVEGAREDVDRQGQGGEEAKDLEAARPHEDGRVVLEMPALASP